MTTMFLYLVAFIVKNLATLRNHIVHHRALCRHLPALIAPTAQVVMVIMQKEFTKIWHIPMRYDRQIHVKADTGILKNSTKFL
jgi:hypothetical protein